MYHLYKGYCSPFKTEIISRGAWKCMSSESKTRARCCRLVIRITWRGTVCKTVSSQNLLTDAWTAAQFANWHQVREAPEQIVISVICWFLWMQHTPFPLPHPQNTGTNTSLFWKLQNHFKFHPFSPFALSPQQGPSSECFTARGGLFLTCPVPSLCVWKQPQPSCCSSPASPGLLCLLGAQLSKQH